MQRGADEAQRLRLARVDHRMEGLEADAALLHAELFRDDQALEPRGGTDYGVALAPLEILGAAGREVEGHGQVVGDVVAADAERAGAGDDVVGVGQEAGCPAAEVDNRHAVALLFRGEGGECHAESAEDDVLHIHLDRLDDLAQVVDAVALGVDHEHVERELGTGETFGL